MSALDLQIEDLLLDSDNPRIGSAKNQREALQKILDDQKVKLAVLAEDIINDGLSPIERLLVIPESKNSKKYIVVEGNRRLAALKILSNPNVLTSLSIESGLQKRFERQAKIFYRKNVEPVACFDIKDRTNANKWIYLRHTGENEGRGVVNWSGLARARFRGSEPALQTLEFVKSHGNLSEEHRALLGDSFPITTLDRLLSSKAVRKLIGVDIKDGKVQSQLPGKELIKPLRRMVLDLAEKNVNVSALKNTDAQVEYVGSFAKDDKPNLAKKEATRNLDEFKNGDFQAKPTKPTKTARKRKSYDPATRTSVVPRTLNLNVSVTKVSEIYGELRDLKMDDSPNACAVLLRVFLELSVDHYMRRNQLETVLKLPHGQKKDKNLSTKIKEVVDHLVNHNNCQRKDFQGVTRAQSDKSSPLHVDLLHAYVHNLFQIPKVRDLRSAWDEAEPLFCQIWA